MAQLLRRNPAVSIVGPRQCGKTTLARKLFEDFSGDKAFFDLEDPGDRARLEDPMLALQSRRGLVVLDEIQRMPHLYEVLRVLADRPRSARFLLLGSAAPTLIRGISESLAGRVAFHELGGFTLGEVGVAALDRLWERGGFPRSYLARSRADSLQWRRAFVRTFLERDIPSFGIGIAAESLRRMWTMLAHYHGQTWNASELARSLGVNDTTARRYLDILVGTYMVRSLPPFHENLGKRLVKSPKIYLRDTGILHTLLAIEDRDQLDGHPKVGASWEGFAIEQILATKAIAPEHAFFWATQAGAELDLLVLHRGRRLGYELKRSSAPTTTKSMHVAVEDLRLDRLDVVYPGDVTYALAPKIRAVPLRAVLGE